MEIDHFDDHLQSEGELVMLRLIAFLPIVLSIPGLAIGLIFSLNGLTTASAVGLASIIPYGVGLVLGKHDAVEEIRRRLHRRELQDLRTELRNAFLDARCEADDRE